MLKRDCGLLICRSRINTHVNRTYSVQRCPLHQFELQRRRSGSHWSLHAQVGTRSEVACNPVVKLNDVLTG